MLGGQILGVEGGSSNTRCGRVGQSDTRWSDTRCLTTY